MYYHFAILLLFRPFIKLRIKGFSTLPRDVCLQAADAIQGLSRSYSRLYTLRRTPSFVPYFVLTSAIMHLTIGAGSQRPSQGVTAPAPGQAPRIDPHIARAISRGIADLTEMAPCHHFAEQALNILLHLAKRWNIEIHVKDSDDQDEGLPRLKELIGQRDYALAHANTPGIRPSPDSLNFFVPEVTPQDVMCTWGLLTSSPAPTTQSAHAQPPPPPPPPPRDVRRPWEEQERPAVPEELDNNPLFWPFPLQGRPLIPSGDKLREAGLEFL